MDGQATGVEALIQFDGPVWRIVPKAASGSPCSSVRAPEGRFHHSGQIAAYASLSAEGAKVAVKRYLPDGIERVIAPMWLRAERVADIRGNSHASIVWQDIRESGVSSPTWVFSDLARSDDAQAMLYSSRSRPELSHVVVFDLECLELIGLPVEFHA